MNTIAFVLLYLVGWDFGDWRDAHNAIILYMCMMSQSQKYILEDSVTNDPTHPTLNDEDALTATSLDLVLHDERVDGVGASQRDVGLDVVRYFVLLDDARRTLHQQHTLAQVLWDLVLVDDDVSITVRLDAGFFVVADETVLLDAREVLQASAVDAVLLVTRYGLVGLDACVTPQQLEDFGEDAIRVVLVDAVVEDEGISGQHLDAAHVRLDFVAQDLGSLYYCVYYYILVADTHLDAGTVVVLYAIGLNEWLGISTHTMYADLLVGDDLAWNHSHVGGGSSLDEDASMRLVVHFGILNEQVTHLDEDAYQCILVCTTYSFRILILGGCALHFAPIHDGLTVLIYNDGW